MVKVKGYEKRLIPNYIDLKPPLNLKTAISNVFRSRARIRAGSNKVVWSTHVMYTDHFSFICFTVLAHLDTFPGWLLGGWVGKFQIVSISALLSF